MDGASPAEGTQILRCEVTGHIARVTLNRPHRMNALSRELSERIIETISELGEDQGVRVIVITGAGGRAFCAGADLKDIDADATRGKSPVTPMTGLYRNVFEAVLEVPKPTIAAIDGYALAGGLELALACDLRLATSGSVFGMPEARIGMGANFASVVLPRVIPRVRAFEVLYTGRRFSAAEALEWGLLNDLVDKASLGPAVTSLATAIAANAPLTVARYKATLAKGWELPVPVALRLNIGPNPYTSRDREEGVRAFMEHREPQWRGE